MQLSYSTYDIRTRSGKNGQEVFDVVRRKWVSLTPEEWVRQHILHFFIQDLGYPKGLISVEKQLLVNGMRKRTDVVLYDRDGQALMLVECKAPDVPTDDSTFRQAALYNLQLRVPYLMITNGKDAWCAAIDHASSSHRLLPGLPDIFLIKQ